jgi:CHAD domain-containing protein
MRTVGPTHALNLPARAGPRAGASGCGHAVKRTNEADSAMRMVRDILIAQLDKAMDLRNRDMSDTAIHDVRKELKRARASLRLLRECLGKSEYHRENRLIRDAARPLRAVRDAKVLLRTFTDLRREGISGEAEALGARVTRELQRERRESRERLERSTRPGGDPMRDARRGIAAVSDRQLDGVPISAGIKRVYKSGLRAFAKVRQESTDERLHEWRKQVKYLFNQIDIVARLSAGGFAKIRKRSHRVEELLGQDHDLAVLQQKFIQIAEGAGVADNAGGLREWSNRTTHGRSSLQRKALKLGRRLYSGGPKRLGAKIDRRLAPRGAQR